MSGHQALYLTAGLCLILVFCGCFCLCFSDVKASRVRSDRIFTASDDCTCKVWKVALYEESMQQEGQTNSHAGRGSHGKTLKGEVQQTILHAASVWQVMKRRRPVSSPSFFLPLLDSRWLSHSWISFVEVEKCPFLVIQPPKSLRV